MVRLANPMVDSIARKAFLLAVVFALPPVFITYVYVDRVMVRLASAVFAILFLLVVLLLARWLSARINSLTGFVERLLGEEARDESCELTPLLPASTEQTGPLLAAMDSHKAEIIVNDSGQILPHFTGLRYCFWTPLRGKNAKK